MFPHRREIPTAHFYETPVESCWGGAVRTGHFREKKPEGHCPPIHKHGLCAFLRFLEFFSRKFFSRLPVSSLLLGYGCTSPSQLFQAGMQKETLPFQSLCLSPRSRPAVWATRLLVLGVASVPPSPPDTSFHSLRSALCVSLFPS